MRATLLRLLAAAALAASNGLFIASWWAQDLALRAWERAGGRGRS